MTTIREMTEAEAKWAGNAPEAAGGVRVHVHIPTPDGETRRTLIAIGEYPSGHAIGDGPEVAEPLVIAALAAELLYGEGTEQETILAGLDILAPELADLARQHLAGVREAGYQLYKKAQVKELVSLPVCGEY